MKNIFLDETNKTTCDHCFDSRTMNPVPLVYRKGGKGKQFIICITCLDHIKRAARRDGIKLGEFLDQMDLRNELFRTRVMKCESSDHPSGYSVSLDPYQFRLCFVNGDREDKDSNNLRFLCLNCYADHMHTDVQ